MYLAFDSLVHMKLCGMIILFKTHNIMYPICVFMVNVCSLAAGDICRSTRGQP